MYERFYKEYSDEVNEILGSYLYWRMFRKEITTQSDVLSKINRTPLFWMFTRHSFQVTLFIALGRIFDTDDSAFSVDDLLKCCINEIDIFSLANLRLRKITGSKDGEPDWLHEYMESSYEPTKLDFQKLRGELSKYKASFEEVYRPIRHKIIAHNDKEYMDKADELWEKTNIEELENIIWFLYDLKETLFDVFQNGKKPILIGRKPNIDFYERDFAMLLDNL